VLCAGSDVRECEASGVSPVYAATYNGHNSFIALLLESYANSHGCCLESSSFLEVILRPNRAECVRATRSVLEAALISFI
jgi:hypothetical protein